MTENTPALQQGESLDLEWLVNNLLDTPGVTGAVLAAQDGLALAHTRRGSMFADKGFDEETAERLASVISGMYALANGVARLTGGSGRDLQLGLLKHTEWSLFVMSAGTGVPDGTPVGLGRSAAEVECTLGVVVTPDADEGAIGYEMKQLVRGMDRHLRTSTRRPDSVPADGQ
ncbi:roadblock/LC7 domain-containing protein [Streptomyces sp. NPDC013161]|uniref:roadblock/LC7 domain-containing protein n=1 Tax=Streptomyces sp. NPDC013161 TaxID=3364862 RepID=UPI00367526A0